MNGFSHALTEDYGDLLHGDALVYLEHITIASRNMGELIDGLLNLSRSTRGGLHRELLDLTQTAEQIRYELVLLEPDRQVSWEIEPDLQVRGDARMLEVVMRNLIGNAWKYSAGSSAPLIRVYAEERNGSFYYCVADNGAGFDMRHADRLFKPFQRLHRQDEFPGIGIGIGLATVQRIIHRHGGEISVEAVPDKGATFCFTLSDEVGTA
jgi:light-regulated signal transduction histidine kinase (bacteriophytochrome)